METAWAARARRVRATRAGKEGRVARASLGNFSSLGVPSQETSSATTARTKRPRRAPVVMPAQRTTLAPLGRIMNLAARRGMVPANPISRMERSERPRKSARASKRILDREEIRRLLDAAKGYRLMLAWP
jgi:integrase